MRTFDLLGIFFVAAWVIAVGSFLILGSTDRSAAISLTDGVIDIREETTWMTAYREGEEVGILREDRTRLVDGWLIEIQGIVELVLMGETYVFRFTSRSTLNEDLTLRSAIADVEAFGMHLKMHGQFRDDGQPGFHLNVQLDDSARQFFVDLEKQPRLAGQAMAQVLATEDLQEGMRFRQEFFDPLTLAPSEVELIYEGREEITNAYFSEGVLAHSFGQSVGNFHSRIHTDEYGTVIRQALPMQLALARVPDALGQSSFADFQQRFEDHKKKTPPFLQAIGSEDLLALVARFGSGNVHRFRTVDGADEIEFDDSAQRQTLEFELHELARAGELDLASPRQHIAFQTSRQARVETNVDNRLWHAGQAPKNSHYQPVTSAEDHRLVSRLTDDLDEDQDYTFLVEQYCPDGVFRAWTPTVPWPALLPEQPSSATHCLALFADALTATDLRPHFVHGALADGDHFEPRVWLAIYDDGNYLGEVDPLGGGRAVGPQHIQLYVDDHYAPQRLPGLVDRLRPH